jgi:hypothetical protein
MVTINLLYLRGTYIAEIIAHEVILNTVEDALALMSDCIYQGVRRLIISERNISPSFFDLKGPLAAEVLQKMVAYNVKLAIVGDYARHTSKSFLDFIAEHNKTGNISFVGSLTEAKEKLTQ